MTALHLSTIISRSSTAILSHISHLAKSFPNHPLLFTLSHNTPSTDDLSDIVGKLTNFSSQSIGCLSAPLPGPHSSFTACSLAIFDPRNAVMFRSTIPGRQQAQVGRWRPVGQKVMEEEQSSWRDDRLVDVEDWEDVWNSATGIRKLPEELEGLRDISSIIYLTDHAPEGLSGSISQFSNSSKVGLVASSTPFVTGRPFTLFRNQNIYDSGAVGIALRRSRIPSSNDFTTKISFAGLSPISKPMTVTQCEGNMVISLDDQNPTQFLLSCIRESGLNMDSTFKDDASFLLGVVDNGKLGQVYNITAGDPSRGTISLDTERSPAQGATVQFLHRAKSLGDPLSEQGMLFAPYSLIGEPLSIPRSLNLFSVSDHGSRWQGDDFAAPEAFILNDTFMAASENGFLFTPKQREPVDAWTCTVPGALVTLECI
ncbi:hypothetical protein APHAL10511_005159 [Amanita phalloides]|nr:hypothetical protein APHAL10511_005159 [Amanita phalloides]